MLLRTITNSIIGASLLFLGSVSSAGSTATWSWAANTNLTSQGYQTTEQLVPQVIDSVVIITAMGVQEAAPGSVERTTPKPEEETTPEDNNSVDEFLIPNVTPAKNLSTT